MMLEYLARLALLLPLLALLIWGSLRLAKTMQARLAHSGHGARQIELVETSMLAPGMRLAVVRFHDREILLGCSRSGLVRLGEGPAREPQGQASGDAF